MSVTKETRPEPAPATPRHLPFLTLILLLLMALHMFLGPIRAWFSGRYRALATFGQALDYCADDYVDPRAATDLVHGAIEGMVESLKDRHSAFLPLRENRRLQEQETARYAGIGVSIQLKKGRIVEGVAGDGTVKVLVNGQREIVAVTIDPRVVDPSDVAALEGLVVAAARQGLRKAQSVKEDDKLLLLVREVFEGSPAAEAGVRPGDALLWVIEHDPDGLRPAVKRDLTGLKNLEKGSDLLRGEAGTKITLGILRDKKQLELTVQRRQISSPVIEYRVLAEGVGYLRIHDFPDGVGRKVEAALNDLRGKTIRGLVLDVRGNTGGFLDEAIRIADFFIAEGVIVSTRNRDEHENRAFRASQGGPAEDLPLAVLVDGGSASAAEVLAGTLQDHGRARLVGQTTFGKGAVNKRFPLGDGSGILLSTGAYILPKGRQIEGKGLEPDLRVGPPPREAIEKLEPGATPPDPQLDAATKLLRALLASP
jgi:C-terminal peptidase prc